jgi:hypothetical protein
MDYNPFLKKSPAGGRGAVEVPQNIAWQNRAEPPTEFENRLADALEQIFAKGAESLPDVIQELNNNGSRDPAGQPWTEESFQTQLKRLGA